MQLQVLLRFCCMVIILFILYMDFEVVFDKLGRFCYTHRFITLTLSTVIFLSFSLGLINIRLETDPQELWVSHDSIGYQQQMDFNQKFGSFFRTEQIIMTQKGVQKQNIFDHQHLYGMYFLLSLINKRRADVSGRQVHIDQLCYKPISQKGCYRPSTLDLWKFDMGTLANDTDVAYTALCIQTPNTTSFTSRIPCSDQNQIPLIKETIFGGLSCDESKDNTSSRIIPCKHCWVQARSLMATYLLNNDQYTKISAQEWEKQVLIDSIHKYNADNGSFQAEYRKHFDMDDSGNVMATGGKMLNIYDYSANKLQVHFEYLSQRSIPDELINQTDQNMWIVIISYTAMFFYIGVAIGKFPSRFSSGFTLAIIGIIIVLASVFSSMGLISFLNIGFTMISAEVIPFLILAIGVDNMFIIKSSIERQPYTQLEDRVAYGLREVGPSITTAAICESLAFLVGSLTKMPALQAFCIQAAIAIFFNYIFQLTAFVVTLIIDQQRREATRMDVACCLVRGGQEKEGKLFWQGVFGGPYFRMIKSKNCLFFTLGFMAILLGLAVVGIMGVPVGLNQQVSMQVDSDLYNYFTAYKKNIEVGPPAYLIFNNFDYTNKQQRDYIETLTNEISKLKYIQPPVYSWFASFKNYVSQGKEWTSVCGAEDVDQLPYNQQLRKFLDVSIQSNCCQNYGICGQQYISDIRFDDNGNLLSSRLRVMSKPLKYSQDYIRAARETRMAMKYVMDPLLQKNSTLEAYPYSLFYVFYDQYSYIRSVAIQNILLGMAVVFLAVTIIQNATIAAVICGVVLLATLNLIGFVWVTSTLFPDHGFVVQINAISVVNLITCIGLSVEFTAHICISMFKLQGTQDQKLKQTLQTTGCSVFIGIGLTKFVGVLVLALAQSTLFRLYYFRMYLGIVLLGLFNGLVVSPVLLYWFGPKTPEPENAAKYTIMSSESGQKRQ